jgi:hypothetical protein
MECAVIYVETQIRVRVEKKSNWSQDENLFKRIYLQKFRYLMHRHHHARFISAPPMKASKKPMTKHAMKVLFRNFVLH